MPRQSVANNQKLGQKIKQRRLELKLTIEEAASRAKVGTKTWSRYEAGEPIRKDKYNGVCRALDWARIDEDNEDEGKEIFNLDEYKGHEAWSPYLADNFGNIAAASFALGSDILLDRIKEDLDELSSMPKGTHVGQLELSWMQMDLPPQFLTRYDYEFLYHLKCILLSLRTHAKNGLRVIAHSVAEEILLYLIMDNSRILIDDMIFSDDDIKRICGRWEDWVFDIFDDMDVVTCLYSDWYLTEDHVYHFIHWFENRFYSDL